MEENIIISAEKVSKSFKDVKAVREVDLTIKKGEYVALLGPNGAGKTTLVEMIEGIQKPDSGTILIKGMPWKGNEEVLHRIIGLSLQETRFFDKLSVHETMEVFASFYNLSSEPVNRILELVNLTEKRKTYTVNLSGGQRQRLALGIALLNNPEVLLLDEPTTGLDPTARREVWDILTVLKKELNTTMILTTHYMEEASYLCDRIVIMDRGNILAKGTLHQLLSDNSSGEVIDYSFSKEPVGFMVPQNGDVIRASYDKDTRKGQIIVDDLVKYLPRFLESVKTHEIELTSLECRKMTLDDLFISMTGRHLDD